MEKNYEGERVGCYHCGRQAIFRAADGWRVCSLKYGAGGYLFCSAKCRHGEDCREIGAPRTVKGSPAPAATANLLYYEDATGLWHRAQARVMAALDDEQVERIALRVVALLAEKLGNA